MFVAKISDPVPMDYRDAFPGTSFTSEGPTDLFLIEQGYAKVNLYCPYDSLTEKLVACDPVFQDGWIYTVAVEPLTAEEIQAAKDSAMTVLRSLRNQLLAACDWTQLADSTADKQAWATYRQSLRDFPATVADARLPYEFPHDPNWVEMP